MKTIRFRTRCRGDAVRFTTLITLTTLIGIASGFTFAQVNEYDRLRQIGLDEYLMGHYPQAETWILSALESARKSHNEYAVAVDYSALGDVYQAELRFTEAEEAYGKAISMLRHQREQAHALAIVWRNLGGALIAEGRFEEALKDVNEASKLIKHNKLKDPKLEALILNTRGLLYFYQGKTRNAETSFVEASRIEFVPDSALDVDPGEILNNLGRVYQEMRQYGKAEDASKRSLERKEARYGNSHPNLAFTLNNLGLVYISTNRYREAEEHFRRSLAILEHAGPTDERLMMQTLHGLGKTYMAERDTPRAEPFLARAAEIVRRMNLQPPDLSEAIEVLETYSQVLMDLSNPVEARRMHEEAQRIRAAKAFTVRANQPK